MSEKDVVENVDSPGAVSIPIASNSAKGIASFNAKDFTVNNGEVSAIWERGVPQYVGTIVGQEEGEGDLTWTVDDASLIDNRPVKIGEYIMLREDAFGFARGEVFVITGTSADENFLVITDNQSVFSLQGEVGPKGDKGDKGDKGNKGDRGEQGKEGAGIKDITNIDYPHGEFENVQYDNTDGIQLFATVRSTRDDGEVYDIPATLDIPVVGKDGIVIDKAADAEKIEISGKNFVLANLGTTSGYQVYMWSTYAEKSLYFNVVIDDAWLSADRLPLYFDVNDNTKGQVDSDATLVVGTPRQPYNAANKKYIDDGFIPKPAPFSSGPFKIPQIGYNGELLYVGVDTGSSIETIAQRTPQGTVRTNAPITDLDAVNKKYGSENYFNRAEIELTPTTGDTISKKQLQDLDTGLYGIFGHKIYGLDISGYFNLEIFHSAAHRTYLLESSNNEMYVAQILNDTDRTFRNWVQITGGVTSLNGQTGALTTKTLFGTNSILGTGNIDLYKHVINFSFEDNNFNMVVYSSKSLTVESLTDLKTLIGEYVTEKVSGLVYDGASSSYYPVVTINMETLEVFYVHTRNGLLAMSLSDYTITDTVTTI